MTRDCGAERDLLEAAVRGKVMIGPQDLVSDERGGNVLRGSCGAWMA